VGTLALLLSGARDAPDTELLLCHATRLLFQLTAFDTYFKVGLHRGYTGGYTGSTQGGTLGVQRVQGVHRGYRGYTGGYMG
jgi:hypothetical protein